MKKHLMMLWTLLALSIQTAIAAPAGWYQLDLAWQDSSFTGQVYYDATAHAPITQVQGQLTTILQTTALTAVYVDIESVDPSQNATWSFLANAKPDGYDAGFYLNVVDLGTTLAIDWSKGNGLYDWSQEDADDVPVVNDWALQAGTISAVPEPSMLLMSLAGLAGIAALHRRRRV